MDLSTADLLDADPSVVDSSNRDLTKRKNTIADERVIAASDTDVDTVINILRDNLKYYKKEIDSP